ncbi:hypothetical protein [Hyphomicrobium sp.]|uniref:hypothetical protein n=1 Tax=Hyphomicrobium sp. TaxID=82 RepID=UPI002E36976C|nr:hypothetical protein [Hyphomicrobium sp.]HEX2842116.1 hypothetical protein [Hyphomicrobium sp.]
MPRSSRTTYETLIWRGVTCRVTTTRDCRIEGWTVITLRAPEDVPFPLGVRGYCHHGLEQKELDTLGGAVSYFKAWADREADSAAYAIAIAKWKQGNLFG